MSAGSNSKRVPAVSGQCLNCGRRGGEYLFTLSGCKAVCFICGHCYPDAKITDDTLLTAIDRACKTCMPVLATRLAGRCCVGCRQYSAHEAVTCNCEGRHYICRGCTQSPTAALKAHAALKAIHMVDTSAQMPSPAHLLAHKPTQERATSTPNWRPKPAKNEDSVPIEQPR